MAEFKKITNPPMGGSGLKKSITDKLEKLEIKSFPKSRKPKIYRSLIILVKRRV